MLKRNDLSQSNSFVTWKESIQNYIRLNRYIWSYVYMHVYTDTNRVTVFKQSKNSYGFEKKNAWFYFYFWLRFFDCNKHEIISKYKPVLPFYTYIYYLLPYFVYKPVKVETNCVYFLSTVSIFSVYILFSSQQIVKF